MLYGIFRVDCVPFEFIYSKWFTNMQKMLELNLKEINRK